MAELATAQDGVVSRAQLLGLGIDDDTILRWTTTGWLHRWHHGVFAVGHRALTARGRRRAALLAGGDGAALSHRAAGVEHGLVSWHPREIDVIVVRTGERCRDGIAFHRPRIYESEIDSIDVDGLRCTTVARTLVDLAAVLRYDRLERAVEQAEFRKVLDLRALADVLARISRPRGVRNLRRCLGAGRLDAALAETDLERTLLKLLLGAGLPRPTLQAAFELDPGEWIRADFHWPRYRLIVEADGPHHAHPLQAAKDARRDAILTARGLRVVRVSHTTIEHAPYEAIERVRSHLTPSRDE